MMFVFSITKESFFQLLYSNIEYLVVVCHVVHVSQMSIILPLVCRCCTLVAAQRVIGICRLRVPEDDIMFCIVF